jgi:hypothetical protein
MKFATTAAVVGSIATTVAAFIPGPYYNLNSFEVPLVAGNVTLPPPPANTTLKVLTVGRGTQNYTCACETAKPVAVGAQAVLFDVGAFLGSDRPDLLYTLPEYLYEQSPVTVGLTAVGSHYFDAQGVPNFDLKAYSLYLKGATLASTTPAQVPAYSGLPIPSTAPVAWLYLGAKPGDAGTVGLTNAYRVETAGGSPPATCAGIVGNFTVQYSAIYAFYG